MNCKPHGTPGDLDGKVLLRHHTNCNANGNCNDPKENLHHPLILHALHRAPADCLALLHHGVFVQLGVPISLKELCQELEKKVPQKVRLSLKKEHSLHHQRRQSH